MLGSDVHKAVYKHLCDKRVGGLAVLNTLADSGLVAAEIAGGFGAFVEQQALCQQQSKLLVLAGLHQLDVLVVLLAGVPALVQTQLPAILADELGGHVGEDDLFHLLAAELLQVGENVAGAHGVAEKNSLLDTQMLQQCVSVSCGLRDTHVLGGFSLAEGALVKHDYFELVLQHLQQGHLRLDGAAHAVKINQGLAFADDNIGYLLAVVSGEVFVVNQSGSSFPLFFTLC